MSIVLRPEATVSRSVTFSGIGVHSGHPSTITILPAEIGHGIVFQRTDIKVKSPLIKLSPESVVEPVMCTKLVNKDGVSVSVVEHLLAALRITEITNALIKIDSPEVPIMDGSAKIFVDGILKVGILKQDNAYIKCIRIKEKVTVSDNAGTISIEPSDKQTISVKLDYDRINAVIHQNNFYEFTFHDDLTDIAQARTFGWFSDHEKILKMGLAKGSSEENTLIIMTDNTIKNLPLRNPKEIVMHKCLDLIGDLFTIECDICGKIVGVNTSHSLNNILLKKLLTETDKHEIITR